MEFVDVECHGQEENLCLYLYLSAQEKTPEPHVLLEHAEDSFDLDGTVHSQENALVCIDSRFHLGALSLKGLGDMEILTTLL